MNFRHLMRCPQFARMSEYQMADLSAKAIAATQSAEALPMSRWSPGAHSKELPTTRVTLQFPPQTPGQPRRPAWATLTGGALTPVPQNHRIFAPFPAYRDKRYGCGLPVGVE